MLTTSCQSSLYVFPVTRLTVLDKAFGCFLMDAAKLSRLLPFPNGSWTIQSWIFCCNCLANSSLANSRYVLPLFLWITLPKEAGCIARPFANSSRVATDKSSRISVLTKCFSMNVSLGIPPNSWRWSAGKVNCVPALTSLTVILASLSSLIIRNGFNSTPSLRIIIFPTLYPSSFNSFNEKGGALANCTVLPFWTGEEEASSHKANCLGVKGSSTR